MSNTLNSVSNAGYTTELPADTLKIPISRLYSKSNNQTLPGESQASVFFKANLGDLTLVENFHLTLLFSHSVISDSLQPHGLQQERVPGPSPSLAICSNSCPLNW